MIDKAAGNCIAILVAVFGHGKRRSDCHAIKGSGIVNPDRQSGKRQSRVGDFVVACTEQLIAFDFRIPVIAPFVDDVDFLVGVQPNVVDNQLTGLRIPTHAVRIAKTVGPNFSLRPGAGERAGGKRIVAGNAKCCGIGSAGRQAL